jgi:ATP-binding cassette subfamily B protein
VVEEAFARRTQRQRRHLAARRRPRQRRDVLRLPGAGRTHRLSNLARIAGFLLPHKWRIAFAAVALLVAAGCVLALGQGLKHVIDAGFSSGSPHLLDQALMAMIGIAAVLAVATWFRFYLMMSTGERVVTDLRKAVFDHILGLDPAFFEAERTGEVISRLTNDTTLLQQVIGFGISMFVRNALMMAGAAAMLFVTSWKLAAFVLLGVPATLIPILVLGRRVRRLSRASQDRVADVSAYVDEAIHEIRTAQAYAHEDADRAAFARHAEAAYAVALSRIRQKAFLIGSVILIAFSAVGIILWVGGHDVLAGRLSAGELSAFVFYAVVVATGAGTVSEVWGELQRAAGATERLMQLLDTQPQIVAPAAPVLPPSRASRALEFDAVGFSYPARPGVAALRGFTLRVAPGERVAVVGPSGAGKSTVFSLLLRFYDPQLGAVRIDGIDVRDMEPRELRRLIAVVPQEPVIFAASVLDNVRYGRPGASREEVLAACGKANALEFIERLPQGLDTPLGERGVTLSGGQRQRLSIARALLADRPVLLLDEATSSLDAASERLVQQALEALEAGRTTLVIAHRLATVQHADRIVVLERGAIVAQGTHAELMRQGGLYSSLARLQFLGAAPIERVA